MIVYASKKNRNPQKMQANMVHSNEAFTFVKSDKIWSRAIIVYIAGNKI